MLALIQTLRVQNTSITDIINIIEYIDSGKFDGNTTEYLKYISKINVNNNSKRWQLRNKLIIELENILNEKIKTNILTDTYFMEEKFIDKQEILCGNI